MPWADHMNLDIAELARPAPQSPEPSKRRVPDARLLAGGPILLIFLLTSLVPSWFATYTPNAGDLHNALLGPSTVHWFGTDELGRDIFSRLVYGARYSLLVASGALALSSIVGTLIGLLAGWVGGWVDELVMRLLDILMAFPGVLLAITIIAGLGPGLTNVIIAMGIYTIPTFARMVRSGTISLKGEEFITASRALGTSNLTIVRRYILPNMLATTVLVQVVLRFGVVILTAAGLGFLGLGVQPPTPEWGEMINDGRQYLTTAPQAMMFPGAALVCVVLAFNLVGEWLQDVTNPRTK